MQKICLIFYSSLFYRVSGFVFILFFVWCDGFSLSLFWYAHCTLVTLVENPAGYFIYGLDSPKLVSFSHCSVLSEFIHTHSIHWIEMVVWYDFPFFELFNSVHVHGYTLLHLINLNAISPFAFLARHLLCPLLVFLWARLLRVQFMRMDFTCLLYFSATHQFQNANTISNSLPRLSTLSISFSDSFSLHTHTDVCVCC